MNCAGKGFCQAKAVTLFRQPVQLYAQTIIYAYNYMHSFVVLTDENRNNRLEEYKQPYYPPYPLTPLPPYPLTPLPPYPLTPLPPYPLTPLPPYPLPPLPPYPLTLPLPLYSKMLSLHAQVVEKYGARDSTYTTPTMIQIAAQRETIHDVCI